MCCTITRETGVFFSRFVRNPPKTITKPRKPVARKSWFSCFETNLLSKTDWVDANEGFKADCHVVTQRHSAIVAKIENNTKRKSRRMSGLNNRNRRALAFQSSNKCVKQQNNEKLRSDKVLKHAHHNISKQSDIKCSFKITEYCFVQGVLRKKNADS